VLILDNLSAKLIFHMTHNISIEIGYGGLGQINYFEWQNMSCVEIYCTRLSKLSTLFHLCNLSFTWCSLLIHLPLTLDLLFRYKSNIKVKVCKQNVYKQTYNYHSIPPRRLIPDYSFSWHDKWMNLLGSLAEMITLRIFDLSNGTNEKNQTF